MVQFDQAIVYKSTLDKINQKIANFESINLDMTEFKKARDEIIKALESENVKTYQYPQSGNGLKQKDFFSQNYLKSINSLEKLYSSLESYDVYYKASSIFKLIRLFVNSDNKKAEDFEKIRNILVTTLKNLLLSDSLDYKVEGPIVEDLCNMTYLFIKEETVYFGHSETLEKIKGLDYYNNFLSARVAKEISTLDADNPKYAKVFKIKNELDVNGDVNYANSDLISAITTTYITLDKKLDILSNLTQKIEEYNKKMESLQKDLKLQNTQLKATNSVYDNSKDNLFQKIRLVATSIAVAASILIGGNAIAKELLKEEFYANSITLYNPESDEEYTFLKEYTTNKDNKVILHEYTPYKYDFEGEYIRSDKQYDLSEIDEDLTFEEYLNLDLKSLGIDCDTKHESKITLDDKDRYEETYKIVEKIVVDLDDSKISEDYAQNLFWWHILEFIVFMLYKVLTCLNKYLTVDTGLFEYLWLCLKDDGKNVKDIIDELGVIKKTKMSRKEYEETLKRLTKEMSEICEKCSEDIQKYESIFEYSDVLKDDRFIEFSSNMSMLNDVKDKIASTKKLIK